MTEKSRRSVRQADAVKRIREGERFVVDLPIVGTKEIPRPEVFAALTYLLLLVGGLLPSAVIVIHGMLDARQVMQDSIPIHQLVLAAAAVVFTASGFRRMVKQTTEKTTANTAPLPVSLAPVVALTGLSAACCSGSSYVIGKAVVTEDEDWDF